MQILCDICNLFVHDMQESLHAVDIFATNIQLFQNLDEQSCNGHNFNYQYFAVLEINGYGIIYM